MPCASLGFQEHAARLFEKSKGLGIRVIKKDLGMVAGCRCRGKPGRVSQLRMERGITVVDQVDGDCSRRLAWNVQGNSRIGADAPYCAMFHKYPHGLLLEFGASTQRMEREVNTDLEAIQGEVNQRFKDGKAKGETEVEITSRLILLERQKHCALCNAMEEIFRSAADALDLATETPRKTANLLKWRKPLR